MGFGEAIMACGTELRMLQVQVWVFCSMLLLKNN